MLLKAYLSHLVLRLSFKPWQVLGLFWKTPKDYFPWSGPGVSTQPLKEKTPCTSPASQNRPKICQKPIALVLIRIMEGEREKVSVQGSQKMLKEPNQQCPLIKFQVSSKKSAPSYGEQYLCQILLVSADWAYNPVPNMNTVLCKMDISTELPFCIPPLLVGKGRKKIFLDPQSSGQKDKEKVFPFIFFLLGQVKGFLIESYQQNLAYGRQNLLLLWRRAVLTIGILTYSSKMANLAVLYLKNLFHCQFYKLIVCLTAVVRRYLLFSTLRSLGDFFFLTFFLETWQHFFVSAAEEGGRR